MFIAGITLLRKLSQAADTGNRAQGAHCFDWPGTQHHLLPVRGLGKEQSRLVSASPFKVSYWELLERLLMSIVLLCIGK